ncbi:MAG: hypothetical protein HY691_12470, partial [Chloroflexi bacterium]|nr:hypothetical protein [Chloroflexota bacterium]
MQRNARARLKDSTRIPNNTITFLNVKNVEWASNLRADFFAVRVSDEVPFGHVVEFARVFDSTLKTPAAPEQLVAEEQRLQGVVGKACGQADSTRAALRDLASALRQALPHDVAETLDGVVGALTLAEGYQREQLLAQLKQAYPTSGELHTAWSNTQRWSRLTPHAASITDLHQFLRALTARFAGQAGRYQEIVAKATQEVLPRFGLAEFLASPSTVEPTLQAAGAIRDAYANAYRLHHRDYFAAVAGLRAELDELQRQAGILAQLNKLRCVGPPAAPKLPERVAALARGLRLCPHAQRTDVGISANLTCQQSGCELPALDPLAEPPSAEAQTLRHELNAAIRQRVNAVKAQAVHAILARSAEPGIGAFLAAIQAG